MRSGAYADLVTGRLQMPYVPLSRSSTDRFQRNPQKSGALRLRPAARTPHRGRFQLVLAVPPKDMAYPGEIPGDILRPGWSVAAAWSEAPRFGSVGAVQIRAGIEELFRGLRAQGIRYLIKCAVFDKILRILLAAHHIAQLGYIGIFLYKISKFLVFYTDIYNKLTRFDKVSIDILDYQ